MQFEAQRYICVFAYDFHMNLRHNYDRRQSAANLFSYFWSSCDRLDITHVLYSESADSTAYDAARNSMFSIGSNLHSVVLANVMCIVHVTFDISLCVGTPVTQIRLIVRICLCLIRRYVIIINCFCSGTLYYAHSITKLAFYIPSSVPFGWW